MQNPFKKAYILPLIIAAAIALVVFKVKTRPEISHQALSFPQRTVEVIELQKMPFRNRATAYGYVEPAVTLRSKAEVSGKIIYIHPRLKKGASLPKGTVVLRIEPTTFEFSRDQSEAVLSSSQYSLKQLEVEEKSTLRSLQIAEKKLQIGQKELARLKRLAKQNLISRSSLDDEEQTVLQLRQELEDLQGKAAGYSSRKNALLSQIRQSQAQLDQSRDTLGRTEIKLPFDARIGTVSVEKGEYISTGNVLFEALGTDAVEINAQLPVRQFYSLVRGLREKTISMKSSEVLQAELAKMNLQAIVTLVGYDEQFSQWPADILRIGESIDPERDTIGLVVSVKKPYDNIIPGKRPPLLKGMFAAVRFYTPVRKRLVIPRKAVHQGRVYMASVDNKLKIQPVSITHHLGPLVVIKENDQLKPGQKIIITDILPVFEDLPLKPVIAREYQQWLATEALGKQQ